MQAAGVQGAKPRSLRPSNTPGVRQIGHAVDVLAGSQMVADLVLIGLQVFGSGRNIRQPWMESSALMASICAIRASLVTSSGRTNFSTSTPISSARAVAPFREDRSEGFSPQRTMASFGLTPFFLQRGDSRLQLFVHRGGNFFAKQ